jgi:hypothetical protein
MPHNISAQQLEADQILASQAPPSVAVALQLAAGLKKQQRFGKARRLAAAWRATSRTDEQWTKLTEQWALCTYKDVDLPPTSRYDDALSILKNLGGLADAHDAETMGLAGAIFKNKWEWFNQNPTWSVPLATTSAVRIAR